MRLENHPWSPTRRGFLVAAGVTGTVLFTTTPSNAEPSAKAESSGTGPSAPETAVILAVARVGSVYPVRLPDARPPTAARLRSVASGLHPDRLALVRAGADALIRTGAPGHGNRHLLGQVGAQANTPGALAALTALVALAAGTVSGRFDPAADDPARIWIDGLRRLHQLGVQPTTR